MLVIVCGGDGVGKTTLCEKLLAHGNWRTQHFSQPKDMADGKRQYFEFLDTIKPGEDVLCDRFHDGEWVYAPIYRGYTGDYLAEIEEKMNSLPDPVLLIYVTADEKDVMHRIGVRGEDFVKNDDHVKVHMNYHKFMRQQTLPFVVINTSKLNPDAAFGEASDAIERARKILTAAKQVKCPCGLTGSRRSTPRGNIDATYAFIGQNPGHARGHKGMFTRMWTYTSSSIVLAEALDEAEITLDVWFTNAVLCETEDNTVSGQQVSACSDRLKAEIEQVCPQVIVALGKKAYSACVRAGFDGKYKLIGLEHPTHAKRFDNVPAFKASVKAVVDDYGFTRAVLGEWKAR